jgi:hypothetical protein
LDSADYAADTNSTDIAVAAILHFSLRGNLRPTDVLQRFSLSRSQSPNVIAAALPPLIAFGRAKQKIAIGGNL